jgi:hypothetical protein
MHCTPFSNPSTTIKPLRSCVEPVLGSILDAEIALHALTRLRRHTARSVDAVDLLVVAIKAHKLEPGHATEVVGAFAGRRWSRHLASDVDVDLAEVDAISYQVEVWDALLCELVVTRHTVVGERAGWDGVVERDVGHRSKDCGCSHNIAGCIEERCYGAHGLGCLSRCSGCACVVLHTPADSDMGKLQPRAYGWKTGCIYMILDFYTKKETGQGRTRGESSVAQIASGGSAIQLVHATRGDAISWDNKCYRVDDLCWSGDEGGRRKGQDESNGVCEDHCCSV